MGMTFRPSRADYDRYLTFIGREVNPSAEFTEAVRTV